MGGMNGNIDAVARAQVALRAMLAGSASQNFAANNLTAAGTVVASGLVTANANLSVSAAGLNNTILLGKSNDAYGALSLNGANTPATMLGWYGGSGADTNLYGKIPTGGTYSFQANNTVLAVINTTGSIIATATIRTGGYLVSTLPAGTTGDRAYVTDALAPTYLGALTGAGAVVCPTFYNGAAWVSA